MTIPPAPAPAVRLCLKDAEHARACVGALPALIDVLHAEGHASHEGVKFLENLNTAVLAFADDPADQALRAEAELWMTQFLARADDATAAAG